VETFDVEAWQPGITGLSDSYEKKIDADLRSAGVVGTPLRVSIEDYHHPDLPNGLVVHFGLEAADETSARDSAIEAMENRVMKCHGSGWKAHATPRPAGSL
jgi:hypothetical protein